MENNVTKLPRADSPRPVVALVAHDRRKDEMVEWATYNRERLSKCTIFRHPNDWADAAVGPGHAIQLMLSGPMAADAQLGTLIAEGRIDAVFFFWDPLTPQPHDVDVKALLRLAVLYDVSIACNRSSADHIIQLAAVTKPEKYRQDRGPSFVPGRSSRGQAGQLARPGGNEGTDFPPGWASGSLSRSISSMQGSPRLVATSAQNWRGESPSARSESGAHWRPARWTGRACLQRASRPPLRSHARRGSESP